MSSSGDVRVSGAADIRVSESGDIRVLVVDDQSLVRAGFRTILDSEDGIEVVGEASNGDEAIAAVAELSPDVVCMDVQMPGMDGLEATRRITADAASDAAVLVLTTFNREDYLFAALDAGASGFLLKNSSPEQLIEAVQVVARGDALLSPDVTRRVIEAVTARAGGSAPRARPRRHQVSPVRQRRVSPRGQRRASPRRQRRVSPGRQRRVQPTRRRRPRHPPHRGSPPSPTASARCSRSSPRASRTPRSPNDCGSARPP